ncbi:cold-responsive protein kinase 1-like isoform X2 [Magnolia sinica]|uniref:cold-responsive protein kinase 1-like isoform X2 n=1 Tax=Magnolia sinica TaxID=86752 RepID=UPI0026588620|nr:cold-responsive protein kinase 1-like isoform X2 [Magnolia sinica]
MSFCCFGKGRSANARDEAEDISAANNVRLFSYNELRSATRNFGAMNKVGGGGFGVVYKGILRDETQVAVKSLSAESSQGVRPKSRRIALDWPRRAGICMGTARGLEFLHEEAEPHIVHRDIKASNVLLDKDLVPKIGDFGLAKLFPDNVTHISTRVAGTMGYLAPEYAQFGQLTKKADIYSFGVLVLEIISGRSSTKAAWGEDLMVLLEWTWKMREEERLLDILDPELEEYPEEEVLRFIKVALFCTQAAAQQRPSMKQVVEMLSNKITFNEKMLTKPGILRNPDHSSKDTGSSSNSSQGHKGKRSTTNTYPNITSSNISSSPLSMTDVEPR